METEPVKSLERYRSYLRVLIDLQISPKMRGKLDPSGVIQRHVQP